MTSKLIVNNIEADAGVSTITFGSEISASKITTSSTSEFSSGLNVTGTLTCDGITSDGDVTIRAATGNLYIKDTDNDGVVAVQRIVGRDSLDNDEWILGQTSTSNSNITLGNVNNAEIIFRTNDIDRLQLSGDGSILYPTTTNAMDIGGSSNQFRNAYFDGTVNCDGLSCNGTATITANAGVLEIQDNNNDGVAAQQRINGIDSLSNIDWYLGQTSNTNSDIHLNNVNNNAIVFSTNNTEKLRITSDGYARLTTSNARLEWTASSGSNPFIRSIGSGQQELEFNTGGNEAARFTDSGNLKFPSGQGIDFSATSDAGGMTSELLDDYEEGDFTITLANSVTITTQTQARYVKIGRIVHVTGQFRINSDNSNAVLVMNNLPFVSLNTGSNDGGFSPGAIRLYQYPDPGGFGNYISLVQKNDTNLYFYYSRASNTDGQILAYSNGYVAFSCTYHTAA